MSLQDSSVVKDPVFGLARALPRCAYLFASRGWHQMSFPQTISVLVLMLLLPGGCSYITALRGKIVDERTSAPLADAFVVARWTGYGGGAGHGTTVCSKVVVATTNANGEYALTNVPLRSSWSDLSNEYIYVHKRGYQMVNTRYEDGSVFIGGIPRGVGRLKPSEVGDNLRLDYLKALSNAVACGREGEQSLVSFYTALIDEAFARAKITEHYEIVKYLCERMAGVAVNGGTLLTGPEYHERTFAYLRSNRNDCLSIKLDYSDKEQFLRYLQTNNLSEVVRMLDSGADIERRFEHYHTPLAIAAINGQYEMATLLINRGADIEARDEASRNVLKQVILASTVSEERSRSTLVLLIEKGVLPQKPDPWKILRFTPR
jgi:hypothetical protein